MGFVENALRHHAGQMGLKTKEERDHFVFSTLNQFGPKEKKAEKGEEAEEKPDSVIALTAGKIARRNATR